MVNSTFDPVPAGGIHHFDGGKMNNTSYLITSNEAVTFGCIKPLDGYQHNALTYNISLRKIGSVRLSPLKTTVKDHSDDCQPNFKSEPITLEK